LTKTLLPRKQLNINQGLPVEKKTRLKAVFILVFLFSTAAGAQVVNLGKDGKNMKRATLVAGLFCKKKNMNGGEA
jgi:hypothetical protein